MPEDSKPASPRRIAASRANGAKSRGPVTPEGKARSSQNARKHGGAACALMISPAESPHFAEFRDAYIRRFQPADEVELGLVDEMAACRWSQQRISALEAAALENQIEEHREYVAEYY